MLRGADATLRGFRPILLLELTADHLARAGDRLDEAFEFLTARDYRAFVLSDTGQFAPVATPREGDLWFFPAHRAPDVRKAPAATFGNS